MPTVTVTSFNPLIDTITTITDETTDVLLERIVNCSNGVQMQLVSAGA